jgi:hypothetical protein
MTKLTVTLTANRRRNWILIEKTSNNQCCWEDPGFFVHHTDVSTRWKKQWSEKTTTCFPRWNPASTARKYCLGYFRALGRFSLHIFKKEMFKIDTGSFFVRFYRSIINILALLRIRCLLTPGSGKGFFRIPEFKAIFLRAYWHFFVVLRIRDVYPEPDF